MSSGFSTEEAAPPAGGPDELTEGPAEPDEDPAAPAEGPAEPAEDPASRWTAMRRSMKKIPAWWRKLRGTRSLVLRPPSRSNSSKSFAA